MVIRCESTLNRLIFRAHVGPKRDIGSGEIKSRCQTERARGDPVVGVAMNSELFLIQRDVKLAVSATRLPRGEIVVGRSSHADICLPHDTVSRRHACLEIAHLGVTVRDLESRNGTFVDERRIHCAAVRPGQQLRFGSVNLLLSNNAELDGDLDSEIETTDPRHATRHFPPLRPAQLRVLELLLKGLLEKRIADILGISQHTVHNHSREIYRAFGVHSRPELLLKALKRSAEAQNTVIHEIDRLPTK